MPKGKAASTSSKFLLSVVVCTYRNSAECDLTLASISEQDCQNFETVVIDGGSDNSLVEKLQASADLMVSEPDNGLYHAMNKGVRLATGEFIMFLNAGDFFCSTSSAAHILGHLERHHDSDIHIFRANILDRGLKTLYVRPSKHDGLAFSHQAMLVRRSLYQEYPFNENMSISADADVWRRLRTDGRFDPEFSDIIISNFLLGGRSSDMRHHIERSIEKLWSRYQSKEKIRPVDFLFVFIKSSIAPILGVSEKLISFYYKMKNII